jgi:hypothetical protein
MQKTARIQKRLTLLIAFSIVWIFIGSLVIFHQEQVMGKSTFLHQISFLVPKSKEKTSLSGKIQDHSPNSTDQVAEGITPGAFATCHREVSGSLAVVSSFDLYLQQRDSSPGLRAPPTI